MSQLCWTGFWSPRFRAVFGGPVPSHSPAAVGSAPCSWDVTTLPEGLPRGQSTLTVKGAQGSDTGGVGAPRGRDRRTERLSEAQEEVALARFLPGRLPGRFKPSHPGAPRPAGSEVRTRTGAPWPSGLSLTRRPCVSAGRPQAHCGGSHPDPPFPLPRAGSHL